MAKNYLAIRPVAQFDPTACWAACLEWWARAMGNRTIITQLNLINLYHDQWDSSNPDANPNYGTVSADNLRAILRDARWGLSCEDVSGSHFTCSYVNQKMRRGPCIVGYYEQAVQGNHVVVPYGASATHVAYMDPDGGRFRGLPVGHFTGTASIIVGWPNW